MNREKPKQLTEVNRRWFGQGQGQGKRWLQTICMLLVLGCFWIGPAEAFNYEVVKGDSLYLIGQRYGVSYQEISRANGLTDTVIYPGQILNVPETAQTAMAGGGSCAVSTISYSDLDLLARVVYGEARGESYEGQVAVAAVVLNRVKSANFPNTIAGVVYQKGAFTAVSDGQINLMPNQTAYKAAQEAANGADPTGGALYYYNPQTSTSEWIFSRAVTTVIGNHIFAV